MKAGDGQDMSQAGIPHSLLHLVGDAAAVAGDQGFRKTALLAGQARIDPRIDGAADPVDLRPEPNRH